ncbi:hypothetical protein E4P39_20640 [Blastococcus sp. CT_GayMR19]|uniref:hypothetical protein n=1 Tax=Blastococcus sp. CT_GayMR19 TaxID=2559608 RepID=UPI0010749233|nr:hypothetical protein [Blastococcus sp. CT_GayMR19]TFV69951.1 hypothetical protein E4P39_20640 [Blastococcus sp. CT_GayMR19]
MAWWRRTLLTVALLLGAWTLLAVWSGAAQADPLEPEPCAAVQIEPPPPSPPVEPVAAETSPEGVPLEPATCDSAPPPVVPAEPDAVVPPPPGPPDVPVADAPVVIPAGDALVPPPDGAVLPVAPEDAGPAPEAPTADVPSADVPAVLPGTPPVEPDAALVEPAPVEPAVVSPPLAAGTVPPVPCSEPASGDVVATDIRGSPHGDSGNDGQLTTRTGSTTTGTAPALAWVEESGPPAVPASPPAPAPAPAPVLPAPIPMPAPAGPAGPAGTSAAASSCTSSAGAGQHDQADSITAVLDARVAASLAQAALRPSSGFAGAVVGGADDPGVRPG